ncbi:hypothetical protein ZEAMMB73_Zm00001d019688 [Zea mays]|uniref:Uncharacterized protein n=1 Tax=Zea mays TaxID=4577 RepID=A0A1D6HZR5_MAIZE|nr:hypothetical protein ZEAMMB73_Zm00001d019688 [Zea mays]
MAFSAALAWAATQLLRGSLPPARFAAAVSPLTYSSSRQLCSTPIANDSSAAGPWDEAETEILRDVEPIVNIVKDIIHSRRSASITVQVVLDTFIVRLVAFFSFSDGDNVDMIGKAFGIL